MAYFQFVCRRDKLTTIPDTGGGFHCHQINGRSDQKLINSLRNMQLCMLLKKRKILTNSKVVFYMHLQLIKDNIHSVVICYT